MELPYKLLRDVEEPCYAHEGDAGLDLRCAEPVTLFPRQRAVVPTGIAVAIPEGHAGFVLPRSGLASKRGVTVVNAPGLVDAGYRGEVCVALVNLGDSTWRADAGERVAQLVVQRVEHADLVRCAELPESERGTGGFGSTGTK